MAPFLVLFNSKQQKMSTLQYYHKALLQLTKYNHHLQQLLDLQTEISDLHEKIAQHQKKHRRCDKDILKQEQCPLCQKKYGSDVALKLHIKLKHSKSNKSEQDDEEGKEVREEEQNLRGQWGHDKENIRNN